ncbi:hypothetical protein GCM10025857_67900 [Alicyclobacillus contaminans]|uniref:toxin-antitoxin system HicB family antitoxin n=1 Tax=Alicyclobacillus contaminans TaxID=392016 RepID=UPI0004289F51|nr:toxin-antitoxin system HicB family antitoxin [Alicyclobacillus contaminans]GMA55433.1 hypothetical protein GCM10025857_67900 [Alicyclobacillus contaminans]
MTSPKKLQTTLRLPKSMDSKLAKKAEQMGVSKNALVMMILTKALEDEQEDTA